MENLLLAIIITCTTKPDQCYVVPDTNIITICNIVPDEYKDQVESRSWQFGINHFGEQYYVAVNSHCESI